MSPSSGLLLSICAAAAIATSAMAQAPAKPQMTARELFYNAPETPPVKTVAKKPAPKEQAKTEVKKTEPAVVTATSQPVTAPSNLPAGGSVVRVSERTSAPPPSHGQALGLKYSILKLGGDGPVEVAPSTVFHAGDKIRFDVETNGPGYLYIVSRGSSGTWNPIFPSPEVASGDNHVDGFHSYMMPPGSRIVFDEQTGAEKVFIVFSREPEASLENMIYSLQGDKAKPAAEPKGRDDATKPKQMLIASNSRIDDGMVGRLQTAYARDLVVERVDESTPGDKKEKAVYVVNPTGSPDSRVVANLELVHQ
jgi:hypothetical protein